MGALWLLFWTVQRYGCRTRKKRTLLFISFKKGKTKEKLQNNQKSLLKAHRMKLSFKPTPSHYNCQTGQCTR